MRSSKALHLVALGLTLAGAPGAVLAADPQQLVRALDSRRCQGCDLQDADLVHADLRDARLNGAQLQRANLSGARLEGADLRGANLSFTSLAGASLQGADLRGSVLVGTDLRQADLSGALLDPGALSRSHWQQARGLDPGLQSYADLHNAGAAAAQAGRYPEAEGFFSAAIRRQPEAAISWVARGISRTELGQSELAAQDLSHAAALYRQMGDLPQAEQLSAASTKLLEPEKKPQNGNGAGNALLSGAAAALQVLGPLALKAFMPMAL